MKTRRLLAIVLVVALVFAFSACSKKSDGDKPADASNSPEASGPSIDLKGDGKQQMSEERVTQEKLKEVFAWQAAMGQDSFKLTYEDFKEQIGCEANEYEWNGLTYGAYYWYASDNDDAWISPCFTDGNGKLFACGGWNVGS